MRPSSTDHRAAVRMAWQLADETSDAPQNVRWGQRVVRESPTPSRQIRAFVDGCRRLGEVDGKQGLEHRPAESMRGQLPTSQSLRQRMQDAASRPHPHQAEANARTGLLTRMAAWVGLVPEKSEGRREGLLEGLIRTGVPLREELLEAIDQFHAQLSSVSLAQNVNSRARQGATLLARLQTMRELVAAAQSLSKNGHGQQAGLDPKVMAELAQQIEATQLVIARVVALPSEHAAFVSGVQHNWQHVVLQPDNAPV